MQHGQTKKEEMRQQQTMKVHERVELMAADCEKAWFHSGWEDTMQRWYDWLYEMKKKDM